MMDSLPHHVVEHIMERLPVNSLVRLKGVSNEWKSTIESTSFQQRQYMHRQQTDDPDVLMVSVITPLDDINHIMSVIGSLRTLVLGSSSSVKIPTPWEKGNTLYLVCNNSCDGLVCLYGIYKSGFVANPTTRWYRPFPLCQLQQLMIDLDIKYVHFKLGFGKDKFTGTYKPVWLYNSSEIGLENATTCEVFDFSTNAWRYVTPAAPYRVVAFLDPVCIDGSLHWFTECEETKILSFNLHTEAFQVLCKAPFANVLANNIVMCDLDNRLCVSELNWPNQLIWSFDSVNTTWDKMFSIDCYVTSCWVGSHRWALSPLALFRWKKKKKKKSLLFYCRYINQKLIVHDPETKSYHVAYDAYSVGYPVSYYQSLFSIS